MMEAALNDHHAIVARLVAARADLNTKRSSGCALPLGPSGDIGRSPTVLVAPCAVRQVHGAALGGMEWACQCGGAAAGSRAWRRCRVKC